MQIRLCYYNQHWNVYLYTTDYKKYGDYALWSNTEAVTTHKTDDGEYRLRAYTHPQGLPIFSYGLMMNDPKARPGHGGEWSSNCARINQIFGTKLTEVALDSIAVAVPKNWLKLTLGNRVTWGNVGGWEDVITHVSGTSNKDMQWVEIIPQTVILTHEGFTSDINS